MWRACRLVVDTGMHSKGWTRQQAIDYMADNSGLSLKNIENEVDRYITWPGQAVAYKIGELKIRELRSLAETELGADFDIRTFHDAVLENGAVPLSVLEDKIKTWIAAQKQRLNYNSITGLAAVMHFERVDAVGENQNFRADSYLGQTDNKR